MFRYQELIRPTQPADNKQRVPQFRIGAFRVVGRIKDFVARRQREKQFAGAFLQVSRRRRIFAERDQFDIRDSLNRANFIRPTNPTLSRYPPADLEQAELFREL